jgi:tetratricopeptide (TPR) repeat protein
MRTLTPPLRWLVLALVVTLAVGCKKKNPDPDAAGPAPRVEHTGPPLTEDDYKEFGAKLEKAVIDGDKAEVDRLVRVLDLFERSISDLSVTAAERKGMLAGASRSGGQFSQQFIDIVKSGGSYSVVRVRTIDDRPRILLRLIHPEGAVNYHEFSLVRYPDGQIATEDIYIYLSGEQLTQTFRRLLLGFLADRNRGAVAQLSKDEQLLTKHMNDLTTMAQMARSGQHREALATFRRLPAGLQKNKIFQIIAIQAAQGTGDDADYLAELERFRRDYPTDPAADIISIDYYLLKKQYDEAFKAVDRLDKALGGDPYMDVLRAGGFVEAGRYKEARAAAEKAVKDAPKLPQAYWARLTVATKEKNHADTLTWLKKLVEAAEPKLDPANLRADERFVEFVRTPQFEEFQRWVARRAK